MIILRSAFVMTIVLTLVAWFPSRDEQARANPNIVRLPPRSFRMLPSAIVRDLETRGCRIPQTPDVPVKSAPMNVVKGQYLVRGREDWAVLCSIRDTSRILVYDADVATPFDSLAKAADHRSLTRLGYSRFISAASRRRLREVAARRPSITFPRFDHVGIDDNFVAATSIVYYFHNGRWLNLLGLN